MSAVNNSNSQCHQKFLACYIDRQSAFLRRNIAQEHRWLVNTLTQDDRVDFLHLHMERYPAIQQISMVSTCDLLVGVHGNGLSHQLWMHPGSYVAELFWEGDFVWCYTIMANMLQHKYFGVWNGS